MGWKIFGLFVSIGLIIGGLSGQFVLRGTESSTALVVVGCLFLIWDIYSLATHNKKKQAALDKKKEEAASFAENNERLEAPATLTLIRKSSMVGMALTVEVFLNGEHVAALKNGQSAQIPVAMKRNRLSIGVLAHEFEAPSGAKGEVQLAATGFKTKEISWS
jgi:uncharacterized membrane protein YfcA